MNQSLLALLVVISPLAFIATAIASWFYPGKRPTLIKIMGIDATIISILVSAVCGFLVMEYDLLETDLLGISGLGLSLRIDALSILMLSMISLLSYIVIRFSFNYLDGDTRQGAFIGRLAATIASVQLLVLAGNLGLVLVAWVMTSISLHRLLIFYRERPGAIVAARKKFIVARLGDISLLVAVVILYMGFGTGNLEVIFRSIQDSLESGDALSVNIELIAVFITLAALLKSAQFPTHGWLIEVMETPTPVSALLHAGLLNAGPYLIIRMAFIMEASAIAPIILILAGGFTALFASTVFLTQTSIKTALGYSSIAHMGFSLFVCGLGVYPAAMLHLVAHSFYKAHSFLSSGSVVDTIQAAKIKPSKRTGNPLKIGLGILIAIAIYAGFAWVWGIDPIEEFALLAIGGVIVMGLSRIFTSALDSNGSARLLVNASILSLIVTTAFFSLESGTHYLLSDQLPELMTPGGGEMLLISIVLSVFTVAVILQIAAPMMKSSSFSRALVIHLRNGLYVNTIFDRTVRALYSHGSQPQPKIIKNVDHIREQEPVQIGLYEEERAV